MIMGGTKVSNILLAQDQSMSGKGIGKGLYCEKTEAIILNIISTVYVVPLAEPYSVPLVNPLSPK